MKIRKTKEKNSTKHVILMSCGKHALENGFKRNSQETRIKHVSS